MGLEMGVWGEATPSIKVILVSCCELLCSAYETSIEKETLNSSVAAHH